MITQNELESFNSSYEQITDIRLIFASVVRLIEEHKRITREIEVAVRRMTEKEYICLAKELRVLINSQDRLMFRLSEDLECIVELLKEGDIVDSDD